MDDPPDLTAAFAIHRAQRDAIARYAAAVATLEEDARSTRGRALARWARRFSLELHEHDVVEDQIFFPSLRGKVGSVDAALAQLEAEHCRLTAMLAQWPAVAAALVDPRVPFRAARGAASAFADELSGFLARHLATEDADVLPLFWRHYTAAEYGTVFERAAEHRSAHSTRRSSG